jgi:glycosyltransferase involved in cell wall biosynthesis
MRNPLSVYLICGANEADYLDRCLKSFKPISKELVVCLAGGNNNTSKEKEIALANGARVVTYKNKKKDWPYIDDFASARNTALKACSEEWALWVDADDELIDGAEAEIDNSIDQANKEKSIHLIAFRYWVENAGLNPIREMISRKGKCKWSNRVHESLNCTDGGKIFIVDKQIRIHRPKGYKKSSADRNFAILNDELKGTPSNLYYLQQEYFLSQQFPQAIQAGEIAVQFPVLDDTLKYEALCNLGRCHTDLNKRLKYLGEAVSLQPDRREAFYWMGLEYASKNQWHKAWASLRCSLGLDRPKAHYWNLVESIYNWQAFDLYLTACVCADKLDEHAKAKSLLPKPKISVLHATKGRNQVAWDRKQQWLGSAKSPLEIEWLFIVDHDDKDNYKPHNALRCNPSGVIHAWNHGAKNAKGEVLIQMSDDWAPCKYWDALILSAIGATNEEKVLAVSDGHRQDKLLCMAILTQKRLQKQGNMLLHEEYQQSDGIFSDNEFTQRAYDDGVVIEAKNIVLTHENPFHTGKEQDKHFKEHNKLENYQKGKAIYEKRLANNWKDAQ